MTQIAIVGIGHAFPQSYDPKTFWDHILNKTDLVSQLPPERLPLPLDQLYHPDIAHPDTVYSHNGYFVDHTQLQLNYDQLNITPERVNQLDPLFKLGLYAAQQAWQDTQTKNVDLSRAGVIIGHIVLPTETATQHARQTLGRLFEEKVTGKSTSQGDPVHPENLMAAGLPAATIAQALGLGGQTFTLDAACASSLYALKLAADELIAGRADIMLTGGLSRPDCLYTQMGFSQLRALSKKGSASPFDQAADGLVVGEGCGILTLKRFDDAINQGDHIYATIQGLGLSNDTDGALLAPSSDGQLRAMQQAYKQANWKPQAVDLIECHATGTPLGDGVEFQSLQTLWSQPSDNRQTTCVLGSVKSNIGHLLTAAGSASLIRALLAIKHKTLPPTANFQTPSQKVDLSGPFQILQQPKDWTTQGPRRAAVSAFGFGGINAHLLIEEYIPGAPISPPQQQKPEPIAIIGFDATVGPTQGWQALRDLFFSGDELQLKPQQKDWGLSQSKLSQQLPSTGYNIAAFSIDDVHIPIGRFRIPPLELMEMLPQQLLMLLTADNALQHAGLSPEQRFDAGAFIGIGLDPNTTNYQLRWDLHQRARHWSQTLGLDLNEHQLQQWVQKLRDAASPALNANRVIGSLGSIAASRVMRELRMGGAGFTISSEETSGIHALQTAISLLQQHKLNLALAGSVDFTTETRYTLQHNQLQAYSTDGQTRPFDKNPGGPLPADGATALVLKRLSDAQKDGDTIYAVIDGIGATHSDLEATLHRAQAAPSNSIDYLDLNATDLETWREIDQTFPNPPTISSALAQTGHSGANQGLLSILRATLGLHHQIIPPTTALTDPIIPQTQITRRPQHWLKNGNTTRTAGVLTQSKDGNQTFVILSEHGAPATWRPQREALIFVQANDIPQLINELKALAKKSETSDIFRLEQECQFQADKQQAVALIAASIPELQKNIHVVLTAFQQAPDDPLSIKEYRVLHRARRIFYSQNPIGDKAKIAFVFPGSGSHFLGMGQDFAMQWPQLYRDFHSTTNYLKEEIAPQHFWSGFELSGLGQQHALLLSAQVALGVSVSDLVRKFSIEPQAVIGYSLGESSGLLALNAWTDRDGMHTRTRDSILFKRDLAGPCLAAKTKWKLAPEQSVDWTLGVVLVSADKVREALKNRQRVYLLIINTPGECVIGGDRPAVEQLVADLKTRYYPLEGVVTVHCDVLDPVEQAYHDHHLFPTTAPDGVTFYSGAKGESFQVTRENAAASIHANAKHGVDWPKTILAAYADGFNTFIEIGPGSSSTRMTRKILADKEHLALSAHQTGANGVTDILRLLARLIVERIPVDLNYLHDATPTVAPEQQQTRTLQIPTPGAPFQIPPTPSTTKPTQPLSKTRPKPAPTPTPAPAPAVSRKPAVEPVLMTQTATPAAATFDELTAQQLRANQATADAHAAFLQFSQNNTQALAEAIQYQMNLLQANPDAQIAPLPHAPAPAPQRQVYMDREACLEFARGTIAAAMGPEWASVDQYAARVRLPDEPLMLVDRIVSVEGETMQHGRCVTEHDVLHNGWYLDCGRIPTCIAIEAGQADLWLGAYLGVDHEVKGKGNYRLLDAQVVFHDQLPQPGQVISYDIQIKKFFRQADTWFFYFQFEGSVDGKPLLTMRNGCAGFFSPQELQAGKGVVRTFGDKRHLAKQTPEDVWKWLPVEKTSYTKPQLDALRAGDLAACFGPHFQNLPIQNPLTLPDGKMNLVDRVTILDPQGGEYGLGLIKAEADIHPGDWFLTCHFVDDMVMPGTLMYECCMHTMRIFLYRMGWIGEASQLVTQPVPGIASQLKCRGQVLETTKVVTYEVHIKEVGYEPEPYAIAEAIMYSDNKMIVDIQNMCLRFTGLTEPQLRQLWWGDADTSGAALQSRAIEGGNAAQNSNKEGTRHQSGAALQSRAPKGQSPNKEQAWRNTTQETPPNKTTLQSNKSPKTEKETISIKANNHLKHWGTRQNPYFSYDRLLAFAKGNPSEAFGDKYKPFDRDRKIARFPSPPFLLMSRVLETDVDPWILTSGGKAIVEYDIPTDAWYFEENNQTQIPYSILLEIALQSCGWLAAYMGSATYSPHDLLFRNLGGNATIQKLVTADTGTLQTHVTVTKISKTQDVILLFFDFRVTEDSGETVFEGDTYFGFFTPESMADQKGITDSKPYQPTAEEKQRAISFKMPQGAPFPNPKMRMLDNIDLLIPDGGPHGQGFIQGSIEVDPEAWFFKAHFYQDPVWPGSLGIEGFIQLLKCWQHHQEGTNKNTEFQIPTLGKKHTWNYRGQILPKNKKVELQAIISNKNYTQTATGYLTVDGLPIYFVSEI